MINQRLKNVRRGTLTSADKVIITKMWNVARIVWILYFSENSRDRYLLFKFIFYFCFFFVFSLYLLCVHYFSYALLTIIRTTKRQRTHIHTVSNDNKIVTMSSLRNHDKTLHWIFQKKKLIWSYLVTPSTCSIQDNFYLI